MTGEQQMVGGRGPSYSPEEDAAILAGPKRESAPAMKARVEALGFPERSEDARKTHKKELRAKGVDQEYDAPRASFSSPERILMRQRKLLSEEQALVNRLNEVREQLNVVVGELAIVAVTADGVNPQLIAEIREAVETQVTSRRK